MTERIKYPHNALLFPWNWNDFSAQSVFCTVDLDDSRIDSRKLDHMRICCIWICSKHKKIWDFGNFVINSCCCRTLLQRDCVWICSKHKFFGIVVTLSATPVVAEIAFGFVQSTKNLGLWWLCQQLLLLQRLRLDLFKAQKIWDFGT